MRRRIYPLVYSMRPVTSVTKQWARGRLGQGPCPERGRTIPRFGERTQRPEALRVKAQAALCKLPVSYMVLRA